MNFSEVKAAVQSILIDVVPSTTARLGVWVNRAMEAAEGRHNFAHMKATDVFVTTEGVRKLADLPATWKELRGLPWLLHADGSRREISWAAGDSELVREFGVSPTLDIGAPKLVHVVPETELDVYPFPDDKSLHPDGDYRVYIPYWSRTAPLVEDADTNWWTTNGADYLELYAAARGFEFNENDRKAERYLAMAEAEYRRLRREDKLKAYDTHTTMSFHLGARGTRFSRGL